MIHETIIKYKYILTIKRDCFYRSFLRSCVELLEKSTLKTCPYTALVKIVKKAIFNKQLIF
jgi:hypothetical protein